MLIALAYRFHYIESFNHPDYCLRLEILPMNKSTLSLRNSTLCLAATSLLVIGTTSMAEIYETEDADGNKVFTDSATSDAEKVVLPETNIADRVEESPAEQSTVGSGRTTAKPDTSGGNIVIIPNTHNEEVEREFQADRRHDVRDAEERYEVGDNPSAEELERRKAAKEGVLVETKDGHVERVEHRGHVGGRR